MIVLLCVEQTAKGQEEGGFQCARDLRDEGEREQSQYEGAMMKNTVEARVEESQIVIKMKLGENGDTYVDLEQRNQKRRC